VETYQLPALPDSFANAAPQAPTTAAGQDTKTALTTQTTLQLSVSGPTYEASTHIPASRLAQITTWAQASVRSKNFTSQWLATYARGIGLDTSLLDMVVKNTTALNAGEVGDLTLQATRLMDQVNNKIPKNVVDARFMQQVQQQKLRIEQIISKVKAISQAIEDALRKYQSLAVPIAEVRAKLQEKYDLMFEAIVLNQQLAEKEDQSTDILVSKTAELEILAKSLPAYVAELRAKKDQPEADKDALDAEINRLNGMMPLITKALSMLKPMIFTGNNAVGRYLNLSNMAGGRAMVLGLFISVGMYRWESDIVTQLQEMNQLAVGLAESNIEAVMNQQAQASSAGYVSAVQDYMDMLNRWTTTVATLQQIVDDTAKAQDILTKGFAQLKSEYGKTSSVVQDAFTKVQASQQAYNLEMERIAAA